MKRKYDLNDAIFTYLLQKRSEAAIALASNGPEYEIIESAREITSNIIRPRTKIVYLFSLILGLLIPTMFFIIKDFFNDKISSVYDIEHLLKRSVLSTIYSNNRKYEQVVTKVPNSAIAESFRNLRSSLLFKLKQQQYKVILVSSAQPQDGKSFISFNLATSIASVGFRTLIVDCDLRRPSMHNKFKEDNSLGVSNYMIKKATINEIIHTTSVDNLSFIPAGPVLPNPSELIDYGVLDDMFTFLKSEYEFIIIDAAPIGLVADTIQLMKYASQILVVSRNNFTQKDILGNAIHLLNSHKIDNYDIILNDLNIKNSQYSGYTKYYVKE